MKLDKKDDVELKVIFSSYVYDGRGKNLGLNNVASLPNELWTIPDGPVTVAGECTTLLLSLCTTITFKKKCFFSQLLQGIAMA